MPRPSLSFRVSVVFLGLAGLQALAALGFLLAIPADPKNSVLFGFSAARLGLLGLLVAGFLACAALVIGLLRRRERAEQWIEQIFARRGALVGLWMAFFVAATAGWLIALMPAERLGLSAASLQRLLPLVAWVGLVGLEGCLAVLLIAARTRPTALEGIYARPRRVLWLAAIILGGLGVLWLLAALTGLGLNQVSGFWNKAGVPLLGLQIGLAWAAGAMMLIIESWPRRTGRLRAAWLPDALLCALVWLAAFLVWRGLPLPVSHFNTGQYAPNFTPYPLSDAALYDLSAQSILMGNDITMVDKPLHSAVLAALHLLSGSDYNQTLTLQVALLALVPVMLYLLGKTLHSRPAGVLAAGLAIFKEANAIRLTDLIQVSNVKMLMTEMLTMLAVLVFAWLLVRGLQEQPRSFTRLFLAGGTLGLAMLVRLNTAFILPFALLAVWLAVPGNFGRRIVLALTLTALVVAAMLPWMARNQEKYGSALRAITGKTQGVIVNKRYTPLLENQAPTDLEEEEAQPALPTAPTAQPAPAGLAKYTRLAGPILGHYAHNLIGVTVMLAPLVRHETVLDAVRAPYWDTTWDGSFVPGGQLILGLALALVALGLAAAWSRWKFAGLVPLLCLLGYTVTSALSLTSGGRYLVPVDWVVVFYFALGLSDLSALIAALLGGNVRIAAGSPPEKHWQPGVLWRPAGLALIVTLTVGAFPAVFERVYPNYQPRDAAALREQFIEAGMAEAQLREFLAQPGAEVIAGRGFYPRFYAAGQGDTQVSSALHGVKDFPRLVMQLFDGRKNTKVLLPLAQPPVTLADGAEIAVIGCRNKGEFRALGLLLPDDTLLHSSVASLVCASQ